MSYTAISSSLNACGSGTSQSREPPTQALPPTDNTPSAQLANLRYVDYLATGAKTGSSWQNAHLGISEAISAWKPGETILIAPGTYLIDSINSSKPYTLTKADNIRAGDVILSHQQGGFYGLTIRSGQTYNNIFFTCANSGNFGNINVNVDAGETATINGGGTLDGYSHVYAGSHAGTLIWNRGKFLKGRNSPTAFLDLNGKSTGKGIYNACIFDETRHPITSTSGTNAGSQFIFNHCSMFLGSGLLSLPSTHSGEIIFNACDIPVWQYLPDYGGGFLVNTDATVGSIEFNDCYCSVAQRSSGAKLVTGKGMANVRFNNPLNGTSTDVNSSVTNKPTRVFAKARLPGSVSFTIDDRNLLPEFKLLAAACEERGFRAGFAMITRATLGDGVGKKIVADDFNDADWADLRALHNKGHCIHSHTVSETDYSQTIAFNSIGYTGSAASATVRTTGKSGTDNFQLILAEGGNDILEVDCNRLEPWTVLYDIKNAIIKRPGWSCLENGATINTRAHCISDIIEPIDVKSSPKSIPLNNLFYQYFETAQALADLASMGIVSNTHVYTGAYTTAESESILMPLVKGARVASSSYANGIDKGRVLPFYYEYRPWRSYGVNTSSFFGKATQDSTAIKGDPFTGITGPADVKRKAMAFFEWVKYSGAVVNLFDHNMLNGGLYGGVLSPNGSKSKIAGGGDSGSGSVTTAFATWLEILDMAVASGVLVETLEQQYDRLSLLAAERSDNGLKLISDPTQLKNRFDFSLYSNSPLIDYATINGGVTADFYGKPFNTKCTIGAIESTEVRN